MIRMDKWRRDFLEWSIRLQEALEERGASTRNPATHDDFRFSRVIMSDANLRELISRSSSFEGLNEYEAWRKNFRVLIDGLDALNDHDAFQPITIPQHLRTNNQLTKVDEQTADENAASIQTDDLQSETNETQKTPPRPPFNAEYILYLLLRKEEREWVIGDLIEGYEHVLKRFNKRRADLWFYKQVISSLLPLLRRSVLKIGALVWLGRILRRLIS